MKGRHVLYSVMALSMLVITSFFVVSIQRSKDAFAAAPADPTLLIGVPTGTSTIDIAWVDNASDEEAYVVERKSGALPFSSIATLPANTTNFSDTGLLADTLYTYRVKATGVDPEPDSGYSNEESVSTDAFAGPSLDDVLIVSGYAWNIKAGWIKQRGVVEELGVKKGNYGVRIEKATGEIEGWSWSSIYGWVCWGATCAESPLDTPESIALYGEITPPSIPGYEPDARAVVTSLEGGGSLDTGTPENNTLRGWAKVLALGDAGWLKLSQTGVPADNYFVFYEPDISQFNGWAWNCTDNGEGACAESISIGWVAFSGKTLAGNPTAACPNPPNCALFSYEPDGLGGFTSKWYTEIISSWFETRGGDIYSRTGFDEPGSGLKPPLLNGGYNASYLIHANGAISPKWLSECPGASCGGQEKNEEVGPYNLPDEDNGYRNPLGFIDLSTTRDDLVTQVDGLKNKYGNTVKVIADEADIASDLAGGLQDRVYYRNGDLDIGGVGDRSAWTIRNPLSGSGAGTVVVEGDLHIYRPIRYESNAILGPGINLERLASVAWIVNGDIIIDDCIPPLSGTAEAAELSGMFFATGTIFTGHGASSRGDLGALQANCGDASGGFSDADTPLLVHGIMMARNFVLQRIYAGNDIGSESIQDDGRLMANTPPGMYDVAASLPKWRQVVP